MELHGISINCGNSTLYNMIYEADYAAAEAACKDCDAAAVSQPSVLLY
jgi:hypothetical protein